MPIVILLLLNAIFKCLDVIIPPELSDHGIVLKLLPQLESELGLSLTASWQWVPEQSTAALFTHHPDAKYYSVGNLDRAGQILQ